MDPKYLAQIAVDGLSNIKYLTVNDEAMLCVSQDYLKRLSQLEELIDKHKTLQKSLDICLSEIAPMTKVFDLISEKYGTEKGDVEGLLAAVEKAKGLH